MLRTVAEWEKLTGADGLTPAEMRLIRAVRAGEVCWLGDKVPEAIAPENRIRAALLRLLILGGTPDCGLHEKGVTLFGGWIEGKLDFGYCTARGQTQLDLCRFDSRLSFYNAHLRQLSLINSHLPGLRAQGATIDASLFLSNAVATGTVDLNGGRIGGQVACNGARLDGGKDKDGTPQVALNAQGMETRGALFLREVQATGTVVLFSAQIGGQVDCWGAALDGGSDAQGNVWPALGCQRMRVAAGFILRNLPVPKGLIDLTSAHVGDLVDAAGCWPVATDSLILDGFTYDKIAVTSPTTLAARRRWLEVGSVFQGTFTPQPYTQFARVLREMGHAAESRKVLMAAAVAEAKQYQRQHRARRRFARALRRLSARRNNGATAEASAQLQAMPAILKDEAKATVDLFRLFHIPLPTPVAAPAAPDAMTLALARQDFRNRMRARAMGSRLRILWSRVKHGVLSGLIGHGHAPQRAIWTMLATVGLSAVVYSFAWDAGVMVPNSDVILTSFDWWRAMLGDPVAPTDGWTRLPPAQHYETFYALAYAFDVFVPIIDLGQDAAWSASTVTGFGLFVRLFSMVLEVWGWIVTALGAAAVTGLIQRKSPD